MVSYQKGLDKTVQIMCQQSERTYSLIISPNRDVDNDGNYSLEDLTIVAAKHEQIDPPGWIRRDRAMMDSF